MIASHAEPYYNPFTIILQPIYNCYLKTQGLKYGICHGGLHDLELVVQHIPTHVEGLQYLLTVMRIHSAIIVLLFLLGESSIKKC